MGAETFHALKKILKGRKLNVSVGDEGGYAPALPNNEAAIQVIIEAVEMAGYKAGKDISIAIDGAASELFDKQKNKYILASENKELTSEEMVAFYETLVAKYPIISIEDGLAEDDWTGYQLMTKKLGNLPRHGSRKAGKRQIVGDDLFVTNVTQHHRQQADI
jgi:enolase